MDTKIKSLNPTSGGQLEEPRLQEHFQLQVEDYSTPADKIFLEQQTQEGGTTLFVP